MIQKIISILKNNQSFIITSHIGACGDAIGSELALASMLSRLEKKVKVVNSEPLANNFLFLPGAKEIIGDKNTVSFSDIAIVLDCATLSRTGTVAKQIEKAGIIINIDHHAGNDHFGTENYVDEKAAATCEQVFSFFDPIGLDITNEEATCLYAGILVDTGSFLYKNTTPRTHKIAAELLRKGANASLVSKHIYGNFSLANRKLLGMALANLQTSDDGKIAWTITTNSMREKTSATDSDTHDIIDYISSMEGVEVALAIREMSSNKVKISLRSNSVNVSKAAKRFGGGGHPRASGCTIKAGTDEATVKILTAVRTLLEKER